ncbi:MAG TPA: SRPBCC domain-containing protein [Chloroflexota bacterium]
MTDVDTVLTITRTVDAPAEVVWRLWTSPEDLASWWWPARFGTTYEVDLREGGSYRFYTRDLPDMGVLAVSGRYLLVRPPDLLMYTWRWEGGDEPESRVTVELVKRGGRTDLRIRHEGLTGVEERDNHIIGWNDCLDRLEQLEAVR